jgi:hypothetical protein
VIAQPKGINDADPDALKRYCRIIVETECSSNGENTALHERLEFSPAELKEIDEALKSAAREAATAATARGMKSEIVSWEPVRISRINDVDMLVMTYTRSGAAAESSVWVRQFMIMNKDCTHKVIISYRSSEKELWAEDLHKVIETFKFEER